MDTGVLAPELGLSGVLLSIGSQRPVSGSCAFHKQLEGIWEVNFALETLNVVLGRLICEIDSPSVYACLPFTSLPLAPCCLLHHVSGLPPEFMSLLCVYPFLLSSPFLPRPLLLTFFFSLKWISCVPLSKTEKDFTNSLKKFDTNYRLALLLV